MTGALRALTVLGLFAGGVLGMAGSIVAAQNVRAVCWAIDSTGLIVATAILALSYLRAGKIEVAAGFLVYAIGEGIMLTGTPMSLEGSVPSFAAGTALWAAGLALVSVPREFTLVTRLTGLVASVLFGVVSLRIFWGDTLTPIARPLPMFAYPALVITFIGWIWTIVRHGAELGAAEASEQSRHAPVVIR
ncbi:hypothetical protein P8935_05590 [Telmatobacter sp. DSM 110680]|uniref:DUF2878 domain-containing protein n=1 Tax=Telmatobacter sp. DSM 110680 TaxID=3036704 RepID=A0AAU7DLK0_9BACT